MDQSNVRWGEIIGGLSNHWLLNGAGNQSVGADLARADDEVLDLHHGDGALFGVGFYTEHHWKLPTTSRGILTIATLLVPLNFLAIAAVSAGSQAVLW
jgi:hypothetical protein